VNIILRRIHKPKRRYRVTQEQAIEQALAALSQRGSRVGTTPIRTRRLEELSNDKQAGWLVCIPIKVPVGIEPNEIFVEVLEPDGEVKIRRAM
jgi:hypothetical protein